MMKIKKFVAPDIRRAIKMVRDEQGPDAVIISNKRVDGGVEIVAAIDYDESQLSQFESEQAEAPASTRTNKGPKEDYINEYLNHPELGDPEVGVGDCR